MRVRVRERRGGEVPSLAADVFQCHRDARVPAGVGGSRLRWRFHSSLNKLIRQPLDTRQQTKTARPKHFTERLLALIRITPPPSSAAVADKQGGWLRPHGNKSSLTSHIIRALICINAAPWNWRALPDAPLVERTRLPRGSTEGVIDI